MAASICTWFPGLQLSMPVPVRHLRWLQRAARTAVPAVAVTSGSCMLAARPVGLRSEVLAHQHHFLLGTPYYSAGGGSR